MEHIHYLEARLSTTGVRARSGADRIRAAARPSSLSCASPSSAPWDCRSKFKDHRDPSVADQRSTEERLDPLSELRRFESMRARSRRTTSRLPILRKRQRPTRARPERNHHNGIHYVLRIATCLRSSSNRDENGAALVEYALLLALIAVVCIVVVGHLIGTNSSHEVPQRRRPAPTDHKPGAPEERAFGPAPLCCVPGGPGAGRAALQSGRRRNEPNVSSRPAHDYRYLK